MLQINNLLKACIFILKVTKDIYMYNYVYSGPKLPPPNSYHDLTFEAIIFYWWSMNVSVNVDTK